MLASKARDGLRFGNRERRAAVVVANARPRLEADRDGARVCVLVLIPCTPPGTSQSGLPSAPPSSTTSTLFAVRRLLPPTPPPRGRISRGLHPAVRHVLLIAVRFGVIVSKLGAAGTCCSTRPRTRPSRASRTLPSPPQIMRTATTLTPLLDHLSIHTRPTPPATRRLPSDRCLRSDVVPASRP